MGRRGGDIVWGSGARGGTEEMRGIEMIGLGEEKKSNVDVREGGGCARRCGREILSVVKDGDVAEGGEGSRKRA